MRHAYAPFNAKPPTTAQTLPRKQRRNDTNSHDHDPLNDSPTPQVVYAASDSFSEDYFSKRDRMYSEKCLKFDWTFYSEETI